MAADGYTLDCSKYADSELYEADSSPGSLLARPAAATIYGADSTLNAAAEPVSGVSSSQATLNGTVTPGAIYEASYHFNYGPAPAPGSAPTYGSQTTPVALGPGLAPQQVSATVSGLEPGTPYDYQLVVTDTNGLTVDGPDVPVPAVVVSASPASVTAGQRVTVSWQGISNPTSDDWFGLYQPGTANGAYLDWFYADSCTQSASGSSSATGSCTYTLPSTPGTYEIRLYAAPASGLLTTSESITSLPPPPVNSAPPAISVSSAAPAISGESGAGVAFPGDTLACSNGTLVGLAERLHVPVGQRRLGAPRCDRAELPGFAGRARGCALVHCRGGQRGRQRAAGGKRGSCCRVAQAGQQRAADDLRKRARRTAAERVARDLVERTDLLHL